MSLTSPGPISCKKNLNKSSAPIYQSKYHSKAHTPPDKPGASVKGNPPLDNQKVTQVSKEKKNGKNTPLLDSSDLSNDAAVLWPL